MQNTHSNRKIVAFEVIGPDGMTHEMKTSGRQTWALTRLIDAGATGCKPIEDPGTRWSSYVHRLRAEGVNILTIKVRNNGPYGGHFGYYVLLSQVRQKEGSPANVNYLAQNLSETSIATEVDAAIFPAKVRSRGPMPILAVM